MTSKISIDNRELLQKISTGEAAAGTDFGNAIVRELAAFRLAAMDSEPVRNPVLAYADSYRDMAKQGIESVPIWSVITDLERNIAPLYRHAQPAKGLELAGWQFKSVNGDWLGLIDEHGKNQAVRDGYEVREVFAMADGVNERDQVRREHAEWSQATFGNVGPVGPLKHLSKEALEAAAEPDDLSEWGDMQFLLWDAQRRAGITDEQITQAMIEKLAVNKQRSWPEPKEGEPRLHIKEQPAPLVPDDYQHLRKLYHAQEKRLFKIAQRIKGPAFDKYSHSASQAIDVLEETMHVLVKYYRWLAAHSEPHPKPEVYATDWDSCRKRDDEYQKLKAAGIDFSNASMMISGCSSEHSDIPNGGNYPVIPGAKQRIADAVELLKQAAPAMLADNGGPDGPLAGRLKSPGIPEGWTGNDKANAALMMLDRIETVDSVDDDRIDGIKRIVRDLAATPTGIPIISDTWIPVGERIPEVGVKVLAFPVEDEPIHAIFNGQLWLQDISWSSSDEPIDNVIPRNVTHWMPLPAAPQEPKP